MPADVINGRVLVEQLKAIFSVNDLKGSHGSFDKVGTIFSIGACHVNVDDVDCSS